MNGFVYVDKPEGITSFVASAKVRRLFGIKKAGHTGTLDPMATGVLPIAIGHATRFIELIPSHDKAYRAKFILGKTTDTLDITGAVTGGRRYDTITAIISRWAPPSENATTKYIAFVSERTHIHYLEKVDWKERNRVCAICEAMAFVECGIQYDINEIIYGMCSGKGNMYGLIKEIIRQMNGPDLGGGRAPLFDLVEEDLPIAQECAKRIREAIAKYC